MPLNRSIMEQLAVSEDELLRQLDTDVITIFSTMVGIEVTQPSTQTESHSKFSDCVTAMVGLVGVYNGLITISATRKQAATFATSMLGLDDVESSEVADALGEIANMIGGSFKHHFIRDGREVKLSTPSVITGNEYDISAGSPPDTLTLLYAVGHEHFKVSVYLEAGV
ncbi:MAG: chemotaxis protein CheX [Desulfuromonadaceae bacterium]